MLLKLLLLCVFAQISRSDLTNARAKYDYLVAETLNNPNGVVVLEEKELARYVFEFPRDYDVFIFLTTNNCFYCKTIEKPFLEVAQAYKNARAYYPKKVVGRDQILRPVFFIMTQTTYANNLFAGNFKLKSFPNLYFSSVEELFIEDEFEKQNYMDIHFWRITPSDVRIDNHKVIEWTLRNRPDNVSLPRSFFGFIKMVSIVLTVLGALTFLFIYCEKIVLNEKLWLVGSLIIYMISAGGLYSALHSGTPFVGMKKDGIELIMQGSRNQFIVEGFIIVGAFFLIGASLIGLTYLIKAQFKNSIVKFILVFILIQTATMTLLWVEEVFRSKNFYNPVFFPPNYYIRGGYYKDQGIIQ
jgi:hypothetical protein